MSQVVTRKSAVSDDKEKSRTDSPVKDLKKKVSANADKDKVAADKQNGDSKTEKKAEKQNGDKSVEKNTTEKQNGEKSNDKGKSADKKETKPVEKKAEQEKKVEQEKKDDSKVEKNGKPEQKRDEQKPDPKAKVNGNKQNGDTVPTNGTDTTVSDGSDEEIMVIDETDDNFPELTYDDTSDTECFGPPTPDLASRSLTRRSQAKQTRTPETPLDKTVDTNTESAEVESKETKLLKLKDDPISTDRKLRSTDSPKKVTEKPPSSPKKSAEKKTEDQQPKENGDKKTLETVVIEDCEGNTDGESRKPDTNFSKSRVKVSPYRRSTRLADQTASSVMANYTGNNTTMEMDITETSFGEPSLYETSANDSNSYISEVKNIRGRRSYRQLKELNLKNLSANRSLREKLGHTIIEQPSRPTGTVVGRKRKQDPEDLEVASEVTEDVPPACVEAKRLRLLDRFMSPLRRVVPSSTPLLARRAAPIVGINTDLPMSTPIAETESFDPETLKNVPTASSLPTVPVVSTADKMDGKRCVVM